MKLTKTILTVLALGVCSLTFGQYDNDPALYTTPVGVSSSAGAHGPRRSATATLSGQTGGKVTDSQIEATIATNYQGEKLIGGSNAVQKPPIVIPVYPVQPVIGGGVVVPAGQGNGGNTGYILPESRSGNLLFTVSPK